MKQTVIKDPNATRDYTLNWERALPDGVTIASAAWVVPSGLTNGGGSNTTTTATVRLSGGTVGTVYMVVCRITMSDGEVDDRSIYLDVRER